MSSPGIDLPGGACPGPVRRDPAVAARLASGARGDAQRSRQAPSRRWAHPPGDPVPACEPVERCDSGGCWLVSVRVASDPGTHLGCSVAAAQASRAAQAAALRGETWQAPGRNRPLRAARAVLRPVRIRKVRALRNAVAVPADGWAHGDYRTSNVLYHSNGHRVHFVHGKYVGRAWRGPDLLARRASVTKPQVADVLLDAVLAHRGSGQAPDVGMVLWWSCVGVLAEQRTGAPGRDQALDLGAVLP